MLEFPNCLSCRYFANDYHLVCVPHPYGPVGNTCPDFRPGPELMPKRFVDFLGLQQQNRENIDADEPISNPFELEPNEEQWQPEGARFVNGDLVIDRVRSFYNGEEIIQPRQPWTREEMLQMLDYYPLFPGRCPECGAQIDRDYTARVHFDCSRCGWLNDTI